MGLNGIVMNEEEKKKYINEINAILSERLIQIKNNYHQVRKSYQSTYNWPDLDPIRHEVSLCLMFGLNQAAITLTNHLFENLMKSTLISYHSKDKLPKDTKNKIENLIEMTSESREKYGNMDLGDCINAVRQAGLITKSQQKSLHEIRDSFRNAFSHADKEKTFKEGTVPVQVMSLDNEGISVDDKEVVKLSELVIVQGMAQAMQAEKEATKYFLNIDSLARELFNKISNDNNKNNIV